MAAFVPLLVAILSTATSHVTTSSATTSPLVLMLIFATATISPAGSEGSDNLQRTHWFLFENEFLKRIKMAAFLLLLYFKQRLNLLFVRYALSGAPTGPLPPGRLS